jgi:hypothetical protein
MDTGMNIDKDTDTARTQTQAWTSAGTYTDTKMEKKLTWTPLDTYM